MPPHTTLIAAPNSAQENVNQMGNNRGNGTQWAAKWRSRKAFWIAKRITA